MDLGWLDWKDPWLALGGALIALAYGLNAAEPWSWYPWPSIWRRTKYFGGTTYVIRYCAFLLVFAGVIGLISWAVSKAGKTWAMDAAGTDVFGRGAAVLVTSVGLCELIKLLVRRERKALSTKLAKLDPQLPMQAQDDDDHIGAVVYRLTIRVCTSLYKQLRLPLRSGCNLLLLEEFKYESLAVVGLALGLRRDLATGFGELADAIRPITDYEWALEKKREAIACLTSNALLTLFDGYTHARAEVSSITQLLEKQFGDLDNAYRKLEWRYRSASTGDAKAAITRKAGQ